MLRMRQAAVWGVGALCMPDVPAGLCVLPMLVSQHRAAACAASVEQHVCRA